MKLSGILVGVLLSGEAELLVQVSARDYRRYCSTGSNLVFESFGVDVEV